MGNNWILAVAGDEAPSTVGSTPLGEEVQTTTVQPADPNEVGTATRTPQSQWMQMLPFVLIFVVMYFLLFRGPKKKQQKHKQMIQALEKNDKVQTIGGIIGTVIDVKDDEVTLKVDESNNTKIKIAPNAVGRNISKEK